MIIYQFERIIDVYTFFTENGDLYKVEFINSNWFEIGLFEVKEISFYANGGLDRITPDLYIQSTISAIIQDFLLNNPYSAVSYVCESIDGYTRAAARAKLFQRWFDATSTKNYIHLQGEIKDLEAQITYYNGIIFSKANPLGNLLIDTFQELNQSLSK